MRWHPKTRTSDNVIPFAKKSFVAQWQYDIPRRLFVPSEELCIFLGSHPSDPLRIYWDQVHPKDSRSIQRAYSNALRNRTKLSVEVRIFLEDGSLRYVYLHADPIFDSSGNPASLVGTIRDITERKRAQSRFFVSEEQYRSLFEHNPDPVFMFDTRGNFIDVNPACEKLTGISREELLNMSWARVVDPQSIKAVSLKFDASLNGHVQNYETEIRAKNGRRHQLRITNVPITANDSVVGVYGIAKDVTERNNQLAKLQESEQRYSALVSHASDIFVIVDDGLRIQYVSPQVVDLLGFTVENLTDRELKEIIYPEDESLFADIAGNCGPGDSETVELRVMQVNGSVRYCETKITNLREEPGVDGLFVSFHDITDKKHSQELINYMAYYDHLTGLPNRRQFEEKMLFTLGLANRSKSMLAVMYLDLDRFKFINDTLGHQTGDRLLNLIKDRLASKVREPALLARMGGDEFAILLPNISERDQPIRFATRIVQAFEKPFLLDQYELYVTASMGVSIYPNDGDSTEALLKNADIALYRAKEHGNNGFQIYSTTMDVQAYKTFVLANDLHTAIENRQFELYYQPRIYVATGRIVSAEALIRWNHPEWGVVAPQEFISLAEQSGLIVPISEWVLQTACAQLKAWQEAGLSLPSISVNMSAHQFMQRDMAEVILQVVRSFDLQPSCLELEITESTFMENEQAVHQALARLKMAGVKIALDDFGTGYSSLSYLKRFRIDTLKVDRAFIKDICVDSDTEEIVSAIVKLAHSMKLSIVAEGVESLQQLEVLRNLHCDEIQGFLYSSPVPAAPFERLLRDGIPRFKDVEEEVTVENKRKYFRVDMFYPIIADMTITEISGKPIETGTTEVLVEDIGPGGIRFLSSIDMPVTRDICLKFRMRLFKRYLEFYGSVVWSRQIERQVFQYGVEFDIDEIRRSELIRLCNKLAIEVRKDPMVPDCRVLTQDKVIFIRRQSL